MKLICPDILNKLYIYEVKLVKHLILLLFLFALPGIVSAQKVNITGTLVDTSLKKNVQYGVAMALRLKDSLLIQYSRTDVQGQFRLKDLPLDTFELIVSHPGYSDQTFLIVGSKKQTDFNLGKFSLPPKSVQYKEVIVYAYADPVYYKGDTLVYTADSFKVKQNATVEDLLKKLPGIKVDAQGKITAQGKAVDKVFVDGDEFFGGDATIATQNLAANTIESVQIYDKKNEDVSDNKTAETIKVLNLKLKEDSKKGYFGKLSACGDFKKYYEGEGLVNRFNNKQKISLFMLGSNTPRSSFGWQESREYGLSNEMNSFNTDDGMVFMGQDVPQGVPQTLKTGFYFTDNLSSKTKISLNYSYKIDQIVRKSSTASTYYLTDTTYTTNSNYNSVEKKRLNFLNLVLNQKIDSLTDITLDSKINYTLENSEVEQNNSFVNENNDTTRTTSISNTSEGKGYSLDNRLKLKRNFKKKDRELSVTCNYNLKNTEALGNLLSDNMFFTTENTSLNSVNQEKDNTSSSSFTNASANYTEPITKKIKLEFSYDFTRSFSTQNKTTTDYVNGAYTSTNALLSNNFENTRIINRGGAKFIFEVKKQRFIAGSRVRNIDIENVNLITGNKVPQNVTNALPFASYRYKISQNSSFDIKYSTDANQPGISQIQPVPDNTNPNQITIGNPDLLPNFSQSVSANYNSYKPISEKYYGFYGQYNVINNDFSSNVTYDSIGRTVTQFVNVKGNANYNLSAWAGFPVFNKKLNINPSVNYSNNISNNFINNEKNITRESNMGGSLGLRHANDLMEVSLDCNYNYYIPSSTYSSKSNTPYSTTDLNASIVLFLPKGFSFETNADYTINSKRAAGYNVNYVIWNASLEKTFLKSKNLIAAIDAHDILNQNVSIKRTVNGNVISDTKATVIARYILFKLTYKFKSNKQKANEEE